MSDEKHYREVPAELETHSSAEAQMPTPVPVQGGGREVPQENIVAEPIDVGASQSAFTPNKSGAVVSGIVTPAVLTGQELYKGYNYLTQGRSANQKYADAMIGDRWNIPLKDIQKLTNYPVPLSHFRLIQDAAKQITGMPAVPDTFKDIYVIDPRTGHKVLSHTEVTPGTAKIPPMDPELLKPYERTIKNKVIQHGALPARAGVAAYDIGRALSPNEDPFAKAADVAAGYSMAASHFLPKKVGKVPVKAIATGLGAVPLAVGAAEATQQADGGLVHLAGGGQPEIGEARAYEPTFNERIYDAIAPYIGQQQARGLMGRPGADVYSQFNPLSILAQYPGDVAQDVKDVAGSIHERDPMGAAFEGLNLAWDAAPLVGKMSKIPARFIKNRAETMGWEKGVNPVIEKAAPYVGKGIKALKKYLPKGEYEGALTESRLPAFAEGKKVSVAKAAARMARESSDVSPEISQKVAEMLAQAPQQTVANPIRAAYPGIYKRPDVLAQEAAARVAPEDPMLKRLFGVTRDDLYEMSKRKGNVPGVIPGAAKNPKGSAAAEAVMTPQNEQRILDTLYELEKRAPELYKGMHGWYTMDPQYHRMVELMGPEKGAAMYHRLNTFGGIESPNMPVPVEFNRATAANWLAEQGRMPDWIKYGGLSEPEKLAGVGGMPMDMLGIPGRVGHQRASASQNKFMETGEHGMISPKAPPYIQASSVPELGFQTDMPVGDAHWSRFLGLPDVRTGKSFAASVSTPELQQLTPWWRDLAGQAGLESVPAQAIVWGGAAPQTGVKTKIGAGKLEIQAGEIAKRANTLGISPEEARDQILMGQQRSGKKKGGRIKK